METGGYATTKGMRFQYLWAARQLVSLLAEELLSVRIEPAGVEGEGVDLIVTLKDGRSEYQQCKRLYRHTGKWTLSALEGKGVLGAIRDRLRADPDGTFRLVSRDSAPELRDLAEAARDSRDPQTFYEDQVGASEERKGAFARVCTAWDLDSTRPKELALARDLLSRTYSSQSDDDEAALRDLRVLVRSYVDGEPSSVIATLESWSKTQLRTSISVSDVEAHLESNGFHVRNLAREPRVLPAVRQLEELFKTSFENQLVQGRMLARDETGQIIELLEQVEGPRLIAVHGAAGVGKSGVLFDLARRLEEQAVPCLPLSLDRQRPRGTTRQYGESLGLPESPSQCLEAVSGESGGVLLLDQLDALRWTGADATGALETCKVLVREAMVRKKIRVVACCRTFDLENDPQISRWLDGHQARKLQVTQLSPAMVRQVVTSAGVDPDRLSHRQLELLRTIQLLRTWEETVGAGGANVNFKSEQELLDAFWESRLREAARMDVLPQTLQDVVDDIVSHMDQHGVLSAPSRLLRAQPGVKRALLSLNVLTESVDGLQFCHQTYLDHQLAHLLMRQVDQGGADLEGWLTSSHQDLHRREQLRLVLGMLRDERPDTYIETIRGLVGSDEIRFHLKLLVLQFLGQGEEPSNDETDWILSLLEQERWREHLVQEVLHGHPPWFEAAANESLIERWLDGDDRSRDEALQLIRSVAGQRGDLCARLLAHLPDRGEEWVHRVASILPMAPADDSGRLFELRLRLTEKGAHWSYLGWEGMGGEHLPRLVEWLPMLLRQRSDDKRRSHGGDGFLHGLGKVDFSENAFDELWDAWKKLIPAAAKAMNLEGCGESGRFSEFEHGWRVHLREFLRSLTRELMRRDPLVVIERVDEKATRLAELLVLEALSGLEGPAIADQGLEWLMAEPRRLRLRWGIGDLPWEESVPVVERLSKVASDPAYSSFERFLLDFREPQLKRSMEARHKDLLSPPEGYAHFSDIGLRKYPSRAGETAYHLLPSLPEGRCSEFASRRLMELRRKFEEVDDIFFRGARVQTGNVDSPIAADRLNHLSDKTWLEIVGHNSEARPGVRWDRPYRAGSFEEASPRTFARDLETATARQPGRFARLAVRFPPDANRLYLGAVVGGLRRVNRKEAPFEDATVQEIEAVLHLPQVEEEPTLSRDIAWLIESRAVLDWSQGTIDLVGRIATQDPNPSQGDLVRQEGADEWGPENLVHTALNCARGAGALAIAGLLFQKPQRIRDLGDIVERVAKDPHPAVRAAGFQCCLAMLEHQPERAINVALDAAEGHEALYGCAYFDRFLRFAARRHPERMEPTVRRMVASDREDVARLGASHASAMLLLHGRMEETVDECLHDDVPLREGVARVAAALADQDHCQDDALRILSQLMEDDSEPVLRACTSAFRNTDLEVFSEAPDFLKAYSGSKAFKRYPTVLLYRLDDFGGDLRPFADCLLTMCVSLAERREEEPDAGPSDFWDASHFLPPVLLRLYEQAPNGSDLRERCLDAWDRLLGSRVISAVNLTKSLEAG